jgi:hypothetical protein
VLKAQAPPRSRPDGFEPKTICQQITFRIVIQRKTSYGTGIRFIVAGHFPQVYGELSGHSGNGFVLMAGVVNQTNKSFVGIGIFSDPRPGALNEVAA